MVSVPGFILRRLYVKGSLRPTSEGFEFELRNNLGSGYSHKVWPLKLDGEEIPVERTYFIIDGRITPFNEVSPDSTFTLELNRTIIVRAACEHLGHGVHTIEMGFDVPGLGTLKFDFTDEVVDG